MNEKSVIVFDNCPNDRTRSGWKRTVERRPSTVDPRTNGHDDSDHRDKQYSEQDSIFDQVPTILIALEFFDTIHD
jgi:hypothetical protein